MSNKDYTRMELLLAEEMQSLSDEELLNHLYDCGATEKYRNAVRDEILTRLVVCMNSLCKTVSMVDTDEI